MGEDHEPYDTPTVTEKNESPVYGELLRGHKAEASHQ